MANPRQRRKARSSSHKAVSHSRNVRRNLKKTPPIRGPKALQDAWDKHKTVKQNYARLGLVHNLNPMASGGSEKRLEPQSVDEGSDMGHAGPSSSTVPSASGSVKPLPSGFGRIIRDEAGNVVGVELPEEDMRGPMASEDETMDDMEPDLEETIRNRWTKNLGQTDPGEKPTTLVEELENIAMKKHLDSTTLAVAQSSTGPNIRHSAAGEISYLQRLVDKHGSDVERMARDRRLNPDQKTEGQLRRALRNAGFLSI